MIKITFEDKELEVLDRVLDFALKSTGLIALNDVNFIIGKARKARQEQEEKQVVDKAIDKTVKK